MDLLPGDDVAGWSGSASSLGGADLGAGPDPRIGCDLARLSSLARFFLFC